MNDRRGTAIVTIFLILFFALIVIVGLLLLTAENSASSREDAGALLTYTDAQAHVALSGLLRQPFPVDLDGDNTIDKAATFADALALADPALDATVETELRARLPKDTFWSVTIYGAGTSRRIDAVAEEKFPGGFSKFQENAGRASVKLSNSVVITLWLRDAGPDASSDRQEADK